MLMQRCKESAVNIPLPVPDGKNLHERNQHTKILVIYAALLTVIVFLFLEIHTVSMTHVCWLHTERLHVCYVVSAFLLQLAEICSGISS